MRLIRIMPTLLAGMFIAITLVRVAEFASVRLKANGMGWLFSIALGIGVYLSAYYTRQHITKAEGHDHRSVMVQRWAWASLIFFVLVDSMFNGFEVWIAVQPKDWMMVVASLLYGVFPSCAASLLGALQGHVDRLPVPPKSEKTNIGNALQRWIVNRINRESELITSSLTPQQIQEPLKLPSSEQEQKKIVPTTKYWCEYCQYGTDNPRQFSGHCNKKEHKANKGKERS